VRSEERGKRIERGKRKEERTRSQDKISRNNITN